MPPSKKVLDIFAEWQKAEDLARQNAVNMLGLPEDNTAAQRALAMGFDGPWYHGTTHNFRRFGGKNGNKEGHLGAGHYLTDNPEDASRNYAGVGPDLTQRIELEAERILNEGGIDWRSSQDPEYIQARALAESKLNGDHDGAVLPLLASIKNEVDVGPYSRDYLDFSPKYDRYGDFKDDNRNVKKIVKTLEKHGIDSGDFFSTTDLYDDVSASDFDKMLRSSEPIMYAEDYDTGGLIGNEVIRDIYSGLGYDGIRLDASEAFPRMDIEPGTQHLVVNKPKNIRSRFAHFDPARRAWN